MEILQPYDEDYPVDNYISPAFLQQWAKATEEYYKNNPVKENDDLPF